MTNTNQEMKQIEQFVVWGRKQESVRAILLTSSRVNQQGTEDVLSDYDLILVLTDIMPFHQNQSWLQDFGVVLALYRDPIIRDKGTQRSAYVVQYETGLKIDFVLWQVEYLQQIVAEPALPKELDAGYRILLDKDRLTDQLKEPTYQGYIPVPPTERDYLECIEVFFLDTTYVAKFLWRDDIIAAKHLLDTFVKQEQLLPMLNWHLEIEYEWKLKPGLYGQRLKQWLTPDIWAELESTYTGAGVEENWEALFKTINLFQRIAIKVGEGMGYNYPHSLHQKAMVYLKRIKMLERTTTDFPFSDIQSKPSSK